MDEPTRHASAGKAEPAVATVPAVSGSVAETPSQLQPALHSLGLPTAGPSATNQAAAPPAAPSHPVFEGVPIANVPVEIGLKSLDGFRRFDIRLAPENLGSIDVRLDIAGDGRVSAHLLVDKHETMQWLQRDSSHLERALDQAGLRTQDGGISVSLRDPSGGESGSGRQGGGTGDQNRPGAVPPSPDEGGGRQPGSAPKTLLWSRASGIDLRI